MQYLLLIAIIPSLIIAFAIYKTDKKEKEPIKELIKAFLLGIVAIIITLAISCFIGLGEINLDTSSLFDIMFYSFIEIALVEELSKWVCGYLFLRKNPNYDYMFDGIVYSVFVALGFATVENILYTLSGGIITGLIRAVSTVPAHAFFGVSIGYCYSLAKREKIKGNNGKYRKYLLLSILVPVLLHGFYDFCLFSGMPIFFIAYLIFVVSLYTFSIDNIKKMERIDHKLNSKDIHCRNCGSVVKDKFCTSCGKRID